jgi:hypothetical protein
MASFVVFVSFLANTTRGHALLTGPAVAERLVPSGLNPQKPAPDSVPGRHGSTAGRRTPRAAVQHLDAELAAALQPVVSGDAGRLAVGVIDLTSGTSAMFNAAQSLRGGAIVTTDILAALLLQHQQAGTQLSAGQDRLAAAMMQDGDNAATTQLWTMIGGARGLAAANATLRLRDTTMASPGASWAWTKTTIADQLQLLADLTGRTSPLDVAARNYALGLMASATMAQRSDVLGAATAGAPGAVTDGSLVGPHWVIGSIGVIRRAGQELLVAVLSDRNLAQAPAVNAARAAALAAASVVS